MKQHSILLAALAFSQLALGETEVNHQSLGAVQAAVDFCMQVKPGDATKYQQQAGYLVSGLSEVELSKLRSADDYKEAYASTKEALAKVDAHEAAKACGGFLEGG